VLSYADAVTAGPSVVGGKGWNLGRLARYGFDVPMGGVLTADAYRAHLAGADVESLLAALVDVPAERADDSEVARQLTAVRQAIEAAQVPPAVVDAVRRFLGESGLDGVPVAVRSSATAEDGSAASFAGIHESVLGVVGLDTALDAVRACYASLWTPRALAYRRRLGLRDDEVAGGVVICRMVSEPGGPASPPAAAGVAFSCDPRTGRRDRLVLNAAPGLGDALVGGRVQPEEIEIALDDLGVRGIVRRDGPAGVLTDGQALRLGRLLLRVHWALGGGQDPQDVEWAFDGERFWLVQARPVTRVPRLTYEAVRDLPVIWSNANLKDALAGVPTTFGWSVTQEVLRPILYAAVQALGYRVPPGMEMIRRLEGRAYFDLTTMEWIYYDALGLMPSELNAGLGGMQPELPMPSDRPLEGSAGRRRMLTQIRMLWTLWRSAGHYEREIAKMRANTCARSRDDLSGLSNADVIAWRDRATADVLPFAALFQVNNSGGFWDQKLVNLIEWKLPGEGARIATGLLAGSNAVVTAEHGYRLIDLARIAEREPAARAYMESTSRDPHGWRALPDGSTFRRAFAVFLEEFGHRGVYELEVANPRWSEDPSYLLEQIRTLLDRRDVPGGREQARARRRAAEAEVRRLPFWLGPIVRWLAERARRAAALREAGKSALVSTLVLSRKMMGEFGARMVAGGLLDEPDHVYHLSRADVVAWAAGEWDGTGARALVADRAAQRAAWLATEPPDVIVLDADGRPTELPTQAVVESKTWLKPSGGTGRSDAERTRLVEAGRLLTGSAVASGKARGPARLIRHPDEGAKLQVGDVLVAPSTDPGWTPLFLRASAVVMEVGGYLSHGAIVAREYGLPAVVNVPGALGAIKDGQMLEVNGDVGEVLLIHS
jgi:pyruvate,water dikinase